MQSEPDERAGGPPQPGGSEGLPEALLSLAPGRLRSLFPRRLALGALFELFLVTAVVSLLLIRGFLALTGFPQVGSGGLHIAHMLWGGLLMLVSLLMLLGFVGRRVLFVAAFLGGVGFGTFIDELGKFITSDSDYFFRPAIAIVYVIFVLLFLVIRGFESLRVYSDRELLANALELASEAALNRRRPSHAEPVLTYLREHAGDDALLTACQDLLERTPMRPPPLPAPLRRAQRLFLRGYVALVDSRRLDGVLASAFVTYVAFILATTLAATLFFVTGPPRSLLGKSGIAFTGIFLSRGISLLLILVATLRLRTSRLAALGWFDRAVTVDLLLGEVFSFYLLQFGALVGVALDAVVLTILGGAIRTQRILERHEGPAPPARE